MSKLFFPEDGIYPHCSKGLDGSLRNLQRAVNDCAFDIPADFPYKDYLYQLERKISRYRREIKRINSTLRSIDSRFNSLSDNLTYSAERIDIPTFPRRTRKII